MLQIQHLTKTYGAEFRAVDDLSLTVHPGEIYGFIGHNGAGKTTTLRCIAGILAFDAGEILIDRYSIRTDPLLCKRMMSYIPDNPEIYEQLTAIQYLQFLADVYGVDEAARQKRIAYYGDAFEMTDRLNEPIGNCSHGMKQKIVLIGALLHEPKLLLLDEPFVGLDPKASHTLKQIMRELCDRGGAIFFSTHVLEVAEKLCDKVAIIKNGRLIEQGDMETVRGNQSLEDIFLELTDHDA